MLQPSFLHTHLPRTPPPGPFCRPLPVPAGQTCDITLTVCVEGGPEGAAAELAGKQAGVIPAEPQPLDVIAILRVEDEGDK